MSRPRVEIRGAKRVLWKAPLKDISRNRAILLTTHSMEEAEALATNVAIMGTRMLAKGTLGTSKGGMGVSIVFRAVRKEGVQREEVEEKVEVVGEGVSAYFDVNGQVGFGLPHEREKLGRMKVMEGLKGVVVDEEGEGGAEGAGRVGGSAAAAAKTGPRKVIEDYTVTGPTLEEVYGCAEAGTAVGFSCLRGVDAGGCWLIRYY